MATFKGSTVSIYNDNKAKPQVLQKVLDHKDIQDLPIVVIPIAGEFRCGKSFLLSYFLRYLINQDFGGDHEKLVGFDHKESDDPVTEGINIWNQPLIVNGCNGKIVVLIMDTQGMFGGDKDNKKAVNAVALSIMLSSIMVYNLKGQINDSIFNSLQLFTSHAADALTENEESENRFQELMILIRDWQNGKILGFEGGKQYLDKRLKENPNEIFSSYFRNNSCYLMPHPGETLVYEDSNGCLNDLGVRFKQNMMDLIRSICDPIYLSRHYKVVAGKTLTVRDFCKYFEVCAKIVAEGKLDTKPLNPGQMHASIECTKAKVEGLKLYTKSLKNETESKDQLELNLESFHESTRTQALEKYKEKTKFSQNAFKEIFDGIKGQLEEECLHKKRMQSGIFTLEETNGSLKGVVDTLDEILSDMGKVQWTVIAGKAVATIAGVAAVGSLFTPLAPIGVDALIVSGATGAFAGVADIAFTEVAKRRINECAENAKNSLEKTQVNLEAVKTLSFAALGFVGVVDDVIGLAGKSMTLMPVVGAIVGTIGTAFTVIDTVITLVNGNSSIDAAKNVKKQVEDEIITLKQDIAKLHTILYGGSESE